MNNILIDLNIFIQAYFMEKNPSRRLLLFIYSMSGGGAERVTANLANYWASKGQDITIITLVKKKWDAYQLHPNVRIISLNLAENSVSPLFGLVRNLQRIYALRMALIQVKPDICIGMMTTANVLLAFASWRLPRLFSIGSERTHPPQYPLGTLWEVLRRTCYRHLNAVVALTDESAAWIKTYTSARRVLVIPNAVVWPLPIQSPIISPEAIFSPERYLLLAVGRLDAGKGFDGLLNTFEILADRHPEWDLVILGDGPERKNLLDQSHTAGLSTRFFLPGHTGNLSQWYERASLYVLSSRFEGFPNTLLEAMAHGLPAVSYDCDTGPRDIIRHNVDGLLVAAGNVTCLTAALDKLMGNTDLRQNFSKRAVEVRQRFSMEKISEMWEKLFNSIK